MLNYCLHNFLTIRKQATFLSLSVDLIYDILDHDDLNITDEQILYDTVLLWIKLEENRKSSIGKILETVRLPIMSPKFLLDVAMKESVFKENPAAQTLLQEAQRYVMIPNGSENKRTRKRNNYKNKSEELHYAVIGGLDDERSPPENCHFLKIKSGDDRKASPESGISCNSPLISASHTFEVAKSEIKMAKIPKECIAFSSCMINNNILVTGGVKDGKAVSDCWIYITDLNQWHAIAPLHSFFKK